MWCKPEKKNICLQRKSCALPLQLTFLKGALKVNVLHVLFASHWSQFHNHLTNSVWVFLAKITFTNQLATNCLQPKQTQGGFHSLTGLLGLFPWSFSNQFHSHCSHPPATICNLSRNNPCDRLLPDGRQQVFMPVWLRPYIHSIWQQNGSWLLKSQQWHCINVFFFSYSFILWAYILNQ